MRSVWGRMRLPAGVLILAACALANDNQDRRSKLPFIADAVGNALPPPSNVPATVGSPVNLLTPDRYEFYTFDESGELVKRLMTLEEIQAIVAAGEESEGLVTFANDNQPTIAFNFSQPPYTKVHSVVTNVQNVLKAQMEAHKNRPQTQPPLDTPDVSDSWSLILPSIFGNTGVDIVPDKTSDSFITPETETIELDSSIFGDENALGKEGVNIIPSSSTTEAIEIIDKQPVRQKIPEKTKVPSISTSTTTTGKPFTTTTTPSTTTTTIPTTTTPTTTTPTITSPTTTPPTTTPPTTTTSTTTTPFTTTITTTTPTTTTPTTTTLSTTTITTTTPTTTVTSTTMRSTTAVRRRVPSTTITSTAKPRTTTTSTTTKPTTPIVTTNKSKPFVITTTRPLRTTFAPNRRTTTTTTTTIPYIEASTSALTTRRPVSSSKPSIIDGSSEVPNTIPLSFGAVLDSRKPVLYEKVSTFVPVSTINYITDKVTRRPLITTRVTPTVMSTTKRIIPSYTTNNPKIQSTTNTPYTTTYLTSAASDQEYDKNSTTITTQSVSPSTTVSSTEFIIVDSQQNDKIMNNVVPAQNENNLHSDSVPSLPLFDVAQSISQIASDLGGNFASLPTSTNLLDTSKTNNMDPESKENIEIDIPTDNNNEHKTQNSTNSDNFIQISTLDPHEKNDNKTVTVGYIENINSKEELMHIQSTTKPTFTTTTSTTTSTSTTIDPILSESMEDLLSQVVHSAPESIVNSDKNFETLNRESEQAVTENNMEKQTLYTETTSEPSIKSESSTLHAQDIQTIIRDINDNELHIQASRSNETEIKEKEKIMQNANNKQSIDIETKISDENKNQINDTNVANGLGNIKESVQVSSAQSVLKNNNESTHKFSTIAINNKIMSVTSSKPLPKLASTTVKPGSTTRKQDGNGLINTETSKLSSSSDKNRLSSYYTNQKDKEPVVFPKVDEFKKKIQKVNIDDKELANERNNSWKLISTVSPPKGNDLGKDKHKTDNFNAPDTNDDKNIILDFSKENQGLEVTTKDLGDDITQFTELCNELSFQYWDDIVKDLDKKRSFVLSPYSITSMLAMMFMGARGSTSGEMNEILKLDDMVTFNPHFTIKNISDSIDTSPGSGVAISAFIRELYSDRSKGKILTFYKERAQHFYNGHVEEINFKLISDIIRRRTNLLVKRYTWGKIIEYMKTNTVVMRPPLAAFSTNIFQTDCSSSSVEGRDGEMYFVVSPNVRQRRLVPVPAVVYRSNFLAGYDPVLDATAAALGNTNSVISTLFLMPGQQGNVVHAEDLETLEKRLLDSSPMTPTWNRLLRTLLPRVGLELQIPRFSHKSIFNVSSTLKRMGLKDLFDQEHADLGGLNGPSKDLYLSDMIQTSTFVTCGEGVVAEQHHIEEYPESLDLAPNSRTARWVTGWDEPRDYQRAFHDPHDVGDAMHLPLHLRPRQARLPSRNAQPARLKFDRPFLYFVRHNPSGMILYVGRYNPRLLP